MGLWCRIERVVWPLIHYFEYASCAVLLENYHYYVNIEAELSDYNVEKM